MPIAYGKESNFLPNYCHNLSTPGINFAYFEHELLIKGLNPEDGEI
jgi:hypothetical protein